MPPLNIMIKPASSSCNLNCSYCFYRDEAECREIRDYGLMSAETLELTVQRIFEYADTCCSISWQGGEPTLAGLDFFRLYLKLEDKYNRKHIPVHRNLQTNGTRITDEWAAFLAENYFLTGISLDGTEYTHNKFRQTTSGKDSFSTVLSGIRLLEKYHADYNILTVVNAETANAVSEIYHFYQKNHFHYQQYIACLDPINAALGCQPWSLTPERYGAFLCELFDFWYADCLQGHAPLIRQFENYLDLMLGLTPESCEQRGICGMQTVVEADGSIYPCDFYVTDNYCLGNLHDISIAESRSMFSQENFISRSSVLPKSCQNCRWLSLCRNGCYRHRTKNGVNYFCESYQTFFEHAFPFLQNLAQQAASRF